jgi:hypothetical protein
MKESLICGMEKRAPGGTNFAAKLLGEGKRERCLPHGSGPMREAASREVGSGMMMGSLPAASRLKAGMARRRGRWQRH